MTTTLEQTIPETLRPLYDFLRLWCYGSGHAVLGRLLMVKFNLSKREFNDQVHDLRLLGCPICSAVTGETRGLYWAADDDDMGQTIAWLKNRSAGAFEVIRALERTRARRFSQQRELFG